MKAGAAADEAFAAPTLDDEDRRISPARNGNSCCAACCSSTWPGSGTQATMSMKQIQNLYQMMKVG
uniref:Uncharacterized protein n=1 Tax=Macrostomum lignano TaxID=282301 RepID=A0A1I8FCY7_9PLAT